MQRPLALLLALWFAGVGCLLSCASHAEASATHPEGNASKHQSMMRMEHGGEASVHSSAHVSVQSAEQQHGCCKAKTASKRAASKQTAGERIAGSLGVLPPSTGPAQCCPLAAASASGVAHRPRATSEATATPVVNRAQFWSSISQIGPAPSRDSFSLLNRGHTHLLCCVFLI